MVTQRRSDMKTDQLGRGRGDRYWPGPNLL